VVAQKRELGLGPKNPHQTNHLYPDPEAKGGGDSGDGGDFPDLNPDIVKFPTTPSQLQHGAHFEDLKEDFRRLYIEVLLMDPANAVDLWREHGMPAIPVPGRGESIVDLEAVLSRPGLRKDQLKVVRGWLDGKRGVENDSKVPALR